MRKSYIEVASTIVEDGGLVAHVMLSRDGDGCIFWPIFNGLDTVPPEEIDGVPFRTTGVIGRTGEHTELAFNEPLDYDTGQAICTAFVAYADAVGRLETLQLDLLYALPDDRSMN